MKNRTRMIALVLAILMVLGLAACAAQTAEPTPQDTPAEQPEETVSEQPQEEPPAEEPAEEPEEAPAEEAPAEEPEQAPTETVFPEAMEVLAWLNGLDEAGTQHPDSALTGAQAQLMLSAVGKTDSGLDTAESVSAGTFLTAALELLGQLPGESVMDSARLARLLPGLTLDEQQPAGRRGSDVYSPSRLPQRLQRRQRKLVRHRLRRSGHAADGRSPCRSLRTGDHMVRRADLSGLHDRRI